MTAPMTDEELAALRESEADRFPAQTVWRLVATVGDLRRDLRIAQGVVAQMLSEDRAVLAALPAWDTDARPFLDGTTTACEAFAEVLAKIIAGTLVPDEATA